MAAAASGSRAAAGEKWEGGGEEVDSRCAFCAFETDSERFGGVVEGVDWGGEI